MEQRPLPRESIGPYVLEDRLPGGEPQLFIARRPGSSDLLALRRHHLPEAELRQAFGEKLRVLQDLQHPVHTKIYDWIESDAEIWVARELVSGRSLPEFLEAGFHPIHLLLSQFEELARALATGHQAGLLCCDRPDWLGSAKVLIDERGRPRTAAFAIPPPEPTRNRPSMIGGRIFRRSDLYSIAPEIMAEEPHDHRADLYACGAVLYRCVTGSPPFEDVRATRLIRSMLRSEFKPPSERAPGLDPRINALILRAMARSPEERFANGAELADALRRIREEPRPR